MSATTVWLIIAVVLGIVELMAATFYLLVLAAAALVGAGDGIEDNLPQGTKIEENDNTRCGVVGHRQDVFDR